MSLSDRASTPPVTAPRIEGQPFSPSAKALGPDAYELTTLSADVTEMVAELALLGITVPAGTVPRLVEAKHDPAAWHRDQQGEDAVTRAVVRRRWVFDWSVQGREIPGLVDWILKRKAPALKVKQPTVDAYVVCLADLQLGKADVHGGTPELLQALSAKLDIAYQLIKSTRPARIVLADLGDCIENFDNTVVQSYTNDLTLPEQLDLYNALTLRVCMDLSRIAPVDFIAVPSNHTAWRRNGSKNSAAKPSDDFAILNARMLHRTFEEVRRAGGKADVTVTIPETFAESLSIDVAGLPIAFAHGHQTSKPEGLAAWWKGQAFGGHPTSAARVLCVGHYHHLRIQQIGGRTLMVCPSMDGGSAWFSNISGEDSPRGLLTFTVTASQWDSLRIL